MKITCAVFDFDGTLFDSMFLWEELGENYLRSLGKVPKPSVRKEIETMSLLQSACYFKEEYDLSMDVDKIMEDICQCIEHFYVEEVLPKPGVADFLEQMRHAGISMCIATASDRGHVERALERCKIRQYFDAIFSCCEVGEGKDNPAIYQKAMEYFGATRSDMVVFEDALYAVRTAKADGFVVAGVFDQSESHQAEMRRQADCYLEDFVHTEEFWKFILETHKEGE